MESPQQTTFVEFIRYNNWANQQVLAACKNLTQAQLDAPIPGGLGSIRDTVVHILRAEASYLFRLTGERPEAAVDWESRPGPAELATYADTVGAALLAMADTVAPTKRITVNWDGKPVTFEARALFIQIINHGIEHRTNITTVLNQDGGSAPEVDGWSYLLAYPQRFALA